MANKGFIGLNQGNMPMVPKAQSTGDKKRAREQGTKSAGGGGFGNWGGGGQQAAPVVDENEYGQALTKLVDAFDKTKPGYRFWAVVRNVRPADKATEKKPDCVDDESWGMVTHAVAQRWMITGDKSIRCTINGYDELKKRVESQGETVKKIQMKIEKLKVDLKQAHIKYKNDMDRQRNDHEEENKKIWREIIRLRAFDARIGPLCQEERALYDRLQELEMDMNKTNGFTAGLAAFQAKWKIVPNPSYGPSVGTTQGKAGAPMTDSEKDLYRWAKDVLEKTNTAIKRLQDVVKTSEGTVQAYELLRTRRVRKFG